MNYLPTSSKNIKKIYKSKRITFKQKLNLIFLFILHWIFTFLILTYFIWEKEKFDKYFIFSITSMIFSWSFFDNNCPISYYEKKTIKKILDVNKMYNPSYNFYCYNNKTTLLIDICIFVLIIFNISFVMIRNKVPKIIIFLLNIYLIIYILNMKLEKFNLSDNIK